MSAIAGFGALKSRYEGTVASRNPITGVGHVAFDEPGFDVEGMRGRGTRGNARNEHADREAQIQASHKDLAQWSGSSQRHPTTEAAPEDNARRLSVCCSSATNLLRRSSVTDNLNPPFTNDTMIPRTSCDSAGGTALESFILVRNDL